jgi:hypothetical protein
MLFRRDNTFSMECQFFIKSAKVLQALRTCCEGISQESSIWSFAQSSPCSLLVALTDKQSSLVNIELEVGRSLQSF